jgi:hypothetical protein
MEDQKDDIIEQLRKVMRLARRAATDGEKQAAEAAAERIAQKHGIDLTTIEATEASAKAEVVVDGWRTYPGEEILYITSVLRQHFGVVLVQSRDGRKVRFKWVGTKINIDIAKHVTVILIRFFKRDWENARKARKMAKALTHTGMAVSKDMLEKYKALAKLSKSSFMDGWFWTIHQKLREHPLRNDREQYEAERKAAEDMLKKMQGISDNRSMSDRSKQDRESVIMGYKAAQAVNLNRPCNGSATVVKALT